MRRAILVAALFAFLPASFAWAEMPEAANTMFEARSVSERNAALSTLETAAAKDPASAYAAGAGEFFTALELLAGGLHRHGFESPKSFMLPLMQLPVPDNPDPQPLPMKNSVPSWSPFATGWKNPPPRWAPCRTMPISAW
ncbi:hypothetical protein [Mesorhizobium sp. M2E.F.Ca.ET.209.01.1.1]|uniref:hypothetical protein n=1 Tax=Mesorhizobium sp. M2E.F.Ca.ET.209.01.1.1 TaxID=2500526 RepID=UPI001FEFD40E|nr:hypothetical protein [Mesorhizobium sp. M2E.F.Ca.ET.209.01.1.1]